MIQFHFALGLANGFNDVVDESDLLFDFFVSVHNAAEHNVFAYFVCACFYHHDGVCGAAYVNVHCALCFLFEIGVDDVFAVNVSHYDRTGGSCKRDIRDRKRDTRTEHCVNFRRNVGVNRKSGCDYAHVVENSLGEQRAERTVDKTGSEDSFVACSAFALFETSGYFAHCVHFFFIIHAEREEIHSGTRRFGTW